MAAVLRAPGKLCSFSYVLLVFLLFYVLDVVSITVYDRDTLLNIGSSIAQRKPDFEFLNASGLFTDTASEPFVWAARPGTHLMPMRNMGLLRYLPHRNLDVCNVSRLSHQRQYKRERKGKLTRTATLSLTHADSAHSPDTCAQRERERQT